MSDRKGSGDCQTSHDWENAFIAEFHNASFGRMFTGILHNLNGVNQAFSLQSALCKSMFVQMNTLLSQIQGSVDQDSRDKIVMLQGLIQQRSVMVEQMEVKFDEGKSILNRCHPLADLYTPRPGKGVSINRIIRYELDILTSISSFKHAVRKKIVLTEDIPAIYEFYEEIHTILYTVLLNAIEALVDQENPELTVESQYVDGNIMITIINSGDSLSFENREKIFDPFFSTKKGHLGVGLYLADKYIKQLGGTLVPAVCAGRTFFTVRFPIAPTS